MWYGCTKLGQIEDDSLAEDKKLKTFIQEIICRHECYATNKGKVCGKCHSPSKFTQCSRVSALSCYT